jgi:flagellar basal body-associated protein FliL
MAEKQDISSQFGGTLEAPMGSGKHGRRGKRFWIIVGGCIVLLLVGGGYYYLTHTSSSTRKIVTPSQNLTPVQKFQQNVQVQVDNLISKGDPASIQKANQIIDAQVSAADKSGDDAYIVSTSLEKATVLINTDQSQTALDTILLPLESKYGNNDTYKYDIFAEMSLAYRSLNNQAKADEYYNKIPGQGWN